MLTLQRRNIWLQEKMPVVGCVNGFILCIN